jgi:hypothetical protein
MNNECMYKTDKTEDTRKHYDCGFLKNMLSLDKEIQEPYPILRFNDVFEYVIKPVKNKEECFDFSFIDENTIEDKQTVEKLRYVKTGLDYFDSDLLELFHSELRKHIKTVKRKMVENFFEKYIDGIDIEGFSGNPNLTEALLEKIEKKGYKDKVYWRMLSRNPSISEAFFERHIDKVLWWNLSQNPGISEAFFEKHIDKVNWETVSRNPNISEAFFERHLDEVNWYWFCLNPSISEAFFEKHIESPKEKLPIHPNMSEAFVKKYRDKICYIHCELPCPNISEDFVENYRDEYSESKLNWNSVCKNLIKTEAFVEKHKDEVCWVGVCGNTSISEAFFERHMNKVNWCHLCSNTNISEAFFERHMDKVNWNELSCNPRMSPEFFEKHMNNLKYIETILQRVSSNTFSVHIEMYVDNFMSNLKDL